MRRLLFRLHRWIGFEREGRCECGVPWVFIDNGSFPHRPGCPTGTEPQDG